MSQTSVTEFEFFALCARGLEAACANELKAMRVHKVRPLKSGVAFFGSIEQGYRACLWSRTASRILLILARVPAASGDELYAGVRSLPWEDHLRANGSLAVDANGMNDNLRNTQYLAVKVKDAICDRFRAFSGRRPDVDTVHPDVRVNVALRGERATIALDLSGEALHRRGYREAGRQTVAPLKEALAAGMLLLAEWPRIAARGGTFVDPLCGSGTLAIEAACIAGDIAPGILREHWGFERWLGADDALWERLLDEADERAEKGRAQMPFLFASDNDPRALELAVANANRALLRDAITFECRDVASLIAPSGKPGLVATNPPYGERMATRSQLPALYAALGARMQGGFAGYRLAVISPDSALDAGLGLVSAQTHVLYNGRIESPLHLYDIDAGTVSDASAENAPSDAMALTSPERDTCSGIVHAFEETPEGSPVAEATVQIGEQQVSLLEANTAQFVARFKKMYALRRKWARRCGITCYRIYDADLPDYAFAIDLYSGAGPDDGSTWVQVFEYAPPREIDPARAARRLADVLRVLPELLGVSPGDIFFKERRRARGGSQYGRQGGASSSVTGIVAEDGLSLEVNLSDYLDTGLFLDHRLTRELIARESRDTRFLNLFAYTGVATVHAASGGAYTTTTVDLSQTYLAWAKRNMERNGFVGETHEYVRADCLSWIAEQRHTRNRWDLIFIDPPTFSNSTRMGSKDFDIQRDHVELLIGVSRLLTRTGSALFSCNLRNFKPDHEALIRAGVELIDITDTTIPEDFSRNAKVHHCYRMRRCSASDGAGSTSHA